MAFNFSPSGYFPNIITTGVFLSGEYGLTSDVTGVFIPYSDFQSYDYDVAINASGDIRQLVYSFVEAVASHYYTLSAVDKSSQMSIQKSQSVPEPETIRKFYAFNINTLLLPSEVNPE